VLERRHAPFTPEHPAPMTVTPPPSHTMASTKPRERAPLAVAVATCGGTGYAPFAPGTFGSALGLLLWLVLPGSTAVHAVALAVITAAGIWSGSAAERYFRRTDPGPVVIDEVAGMLVTLFMNPVGWTGAILAFLLFRLLDVVKPYPANRLEKLPGGLGVMADDVMAALYANVILRLILVSGFGST
jgi:phosphatidylglycerophosphatase A